MFGMTMHGAGVKTIFAQKKLTILNPTGLDPHELTAAFKAIAGEKDTVSLSKLPDLIRDVQQGRAPDHIELAEIQKVLGDSEQFTIQQFFEAVEQQQDKNYNPDSSPYSNPNSSPFKPRYASDLRRDIRKHHHSSQEFSEPVLTSQVIGHTNLSEQKILPPTETRAKSTELSSYIHCVEKHQHGRSVRAELTTFGETRLTTQATTNSIVSGPQHPIW